MCQWGTTEVLEVTIPAHLSYTGEARQKMVDIDSCIAPIIEALNDGGITTIACCCGHGKRPGSIALADGREFIIAPDYDTARKVEAAFPPLSPFPNGSCEDCGRAYGDNNWLDVIIPDEQWSLITGRSGSDREGGILCVGCIVKRAARIEISPGVPMFSCGKLVFE